MINFLNYLQYIDYIIMLDEFHLFAFHLFFDGYMNKVIFFVN